MKRKGNASGPVHSAAQPGAQDRLRSTVNSQRKNSMPQTPTSMPLGFVRLCSQCSKGYNAYVSLQTRSSGPHVVCQPLPCVATLRLSSLLVSKSRNVSRPGTHRSAMMDGANWSAVARPAVARRARRPSSTSTVSSSRASCPTSCSRARGAQLYLSDKELHSSWALSGLLPHSHSKQLFNSNPGSHPADGDQVGQMYREAQEQGQEALPLAPSHAHRSAAVSPSYCTPW